MAGMDEQGNYRRRMAVTVLGVLFSIPLLLAILFLALAYFYNPFRPY